MSGKKLADVQWFLWYTCEFYLFFCSSHFFLHSFKELIYREFCYPKIISTYRLSWNLLESQNIFRSLTCRESNTLIISILIFIYSSICGKQILTNTVYIFFRCHMIFSAPPCFWSNYQYSISPTTKKNAWRTPQELTIVKPFIKNLTSGLGSPTLKRANDLLLSVSSKQTSHIVDKLCPQHFKPRRHNLTISFGCLTPENISQRSRTLERCGATQRETSKYQLPNPWHCTACLKVC